MRLLRVRKNDFFLDNGKKGIAAPLARPPFPFIGNKANRRELITIAICNIIKNLVPNTNVVFDLFGGSLYLSHLIQCASKVLKTELTGITNDYDGYTDLFTPETMEHLLWYKSVCDEFPEIKRNYLLPDEACQRIDNYTERNCPHLDPWVIRLLTDFGSSRHYRRRLTDSQTFWKGVQLSDYIPNTVISTGHIDWKDWIDKVAVRYCKREQPSLWFVDPPYTTYGTGLYYGDGYDNLDIGLFGIVTKILRKFPKAYIVTFGYLRNPADNVRNELHLKFPGNLHYDELNEYWPPCQGLRVYSRPEYMHIWYIAKENRALNEVLNLCPVLDKRNHGHIRADGKRPNLNAWKYDNKFGSI